jgi:hypothetical protein
MRPFISGHRIGGIMKGQAPHPKRLFCIILLVSGLTGCTTNIEPPSGPAETEACFYPAPPTSWDSGGSCGWFIELQSGERIAYQYTDTPCFTIPAEFSPGDELIVEVTGDWGEPGFKCGFLKREVPYLVYFYQFFGTFLVTE